MCLVWRDAGVISYSITPGASSWPLLAHTFSALKLPKFMSSENGPTRASEGSKWRIAAVQQVAGRGAAQGSRAALLPVGEGLDAFPSSDAVQTFLHRLRLPAHLTYITTHLSHWPLPSTWAGIPAQPCSLDWVLHHPGAGEGLGRKPRPALLSLSTLFLILLPILASNKADWALFFPLAALSGLSAFCGGADSTSQVKGA